MSYGLWVMGEEYLSAISLCLKVKGQNSKFKTATCSRSEIKTSAIRDQSQNLKIPKSAISLCVPPCRCGSVVQDSKMQDATGLLGRRVPDQRLKDQRSEINPKISNLPLASIEIKSNNYWLKSE